MGREVTAQDLNLDDEPEVNLEIGKGPDEDTPEETEIRGGPGGVAVLETDDKGREETEKGKGEEDKPFKYANQKEAEKAYREAEKKITELGSKSSKLERMVTDLTKRLDDASKGSNSEPEENPYNKKREQVLDKAMISVQQLPVPEKPTLPDEDDPNYDSKMETFKGKSDKYKVDMAEYNKKISRIWGDAQGEISKITFQEQQSEKDEAQKNRDVINKAVASALNEVGLDPEDDAIRDIFWSQSKKVPRGIMLEEQIRIAADKTMEVISKIRGREVTRLKKDKEAKEGLDILGKGGRLTKGKESTAPKTMIDAMNASRERRRLRSP